MSYRTIKKLLGETSLERKCRFLFGSGARVRSAFVCAPEAGARSAVTRYETFTLSFDAPFAWEVLTRILDSLAALRGPDLLRVKGLVHVA
ncbi:MAG: hypothetical protein B7Z55_08180, partial [Planctomycetales bacterium 12-60-4]